MLDSPIRVRFNYSVHSVNYLPSVSGSSTNLVFVFVEVENFS